MGESETSSWGQRRGPHPDDGRRWRPMPCVWWPWLCQLLAVEDHHGAVDIDLLVLEACRVVRGRSVRPGTLFSIRDDRIASAELDVVTAWAECGEVVTILAGRDGRHSWACLSRCHIRVVLTGPVSDLDAAVHERPPATCTRPTDPLSLSRSPYDSLRLYPRREQFGIA
jgi:hypothetical protein